MNRQLFYLGFRIAWVASVALLLMFGVTPAAQAQVELIESAEYLEDPSGQLTISDVQDAQFQPMERTLLAGYTASAFWFRLRFRDLPDAGPMMLMVLPVMLDHVTLYQAQSAGSRHWHAIHNSSDEGEVRKSRYAPFSGFAPILYVQDDSYLYLRVTSSGSISVHLSALSIADAQKKVFLTNLFQLIYLSCMLIILLWSVRMALLTRERLFWRFATLQAVWILHNLFFFGYAVLIMNTVSNDWIIILSRGSVIVVTALTILFHKTVLWPFGPHPLAHRLLDIQLLVILLAALVFVFGDMRLAIAINGVAVAATPIALLANVLTASKCASPGLTTMRVIYVILCSSLTCWIIALLGLANLANLTLYGTILHGMSTGLLMFAILHLHGRNIIRARQEAQADLAAMVQKRATDREQIRMLVRFLDMLTHETKNALGVITMSASTRPFGDRQRDRMMDSVAALSLLIDRCMATVRMDENETATRSESCDLATILSGTLKTSREADRVRLNAPDTAILQSDPVILDVIISNLLDNALKYSAPQSIVTVTLETGPDARHSVTFENQAGAAGMPDATQLFQRFYRNPRALSQSGSGLGLYLVRGLIRQIGGEIEYIPLAGLVRFRLALPC